MPYKLWSPLTEHNTWKGNEREKKTKIRNRCATVAVRRVMSSDAMHQQKTYELS